MAAEDVVTGSVSEARTDARNASNRAQGFANIALNIPRINISSGGALGGGGSGSYNFDLALYDPERPNVNVPPFSPDIDLGELLDLAADGNVRLFIDQLSTEFTRFVNSYFPDLEVHKDALEARIQDMLNGDGTGLPAAIENALWERGRSRITRDGLVLEQNVANDLAARGFTAPNGVMVARLDEARFTGHVAVAGFSRDVAIRQAEIHIENLRFAMELAHRHRFDAISAAVQYVSSIIVAVLDKGIEKARLIVQAKEALWNSTTRYYDTLINEGRLLLTYEELVSNIAIERARRTLDSLVNDTQRYTEGAITGANAMADIAAQAFGATNTLATLAHDTITGE